MKKQEEKNKVFKEMMFRIHIEDVKKIKEIALEYGSEYFDELYVDNMPVICAVSCYVGNLSALKYLVENGWDIHKTDMHGRNALHYAMHAHRRKSMLYLMEAGIDIDHQCELGRNVFMDAMLYSCLLTKEMKILYENGVNMNARDYRDRDVIDIMETMADMTEKEMKKWINYFLKTPERFDIKLLKKIKAKKLELLF